MAPRSQPTLDAPSSQPSCISSRLIRNNPAVESVRISIHRPFLCQENGYTPPYSALSSCRFCPFLSLHVAFFAEKPFDFLILLEEADSHKQREVLDRLIRWSTVRQAEARMQYRKLIRGLLGL